jgi:hypothetical protein
MKALATFVDWLSERRSGHISEAVAGQVTVDGLSAEHAEQLRACVREAGLQYQLVDDVGDTFRTGSPGDGVAPFALSFTKPAVDGEVFFVSTRAFGEWLDAPTAPSIVRVAGCETAFRTEAFLVGTPSTVPANHERRSRKSPRRVVRDTTGTQLVPEDMCPFLLVEGSPVPRGDVAFNEWLSRAATKVANCVASEVHAAHELQFFGPPRVSLTNPIAPGVLDWFEPLQDVARWVYDLDREVELRHRLFTQEFARLAFGETDVPAAVGKSADAALEGARIAYAFHLQEVSKDALKGLTDLRKAVAEETQKLFEATRQLGLSAAGALFYAMGLLVARLTTGLPGYLYGALLVVGMAYVGLIVWVNHRAMGYQQQLRETWRSKLYRFLTDAEFDELVQAPTRRAERLLVVALWVVLCLATAVFWVAALTRVEPVG